MGKPDLTPLSITPLALQQVIRYCVAAKNHPDGTREACGYVVGVGGVASRVGPMQHVSPWPHHAFNMEPSAVLAGYADFDEREEQVLCVYHSHPKSAAIPSVDDVSTPDHQPAYLIVSLEHDNPSCRAWRIGLEYIGVPKANEVLLHISEDGEPYTAAPPPLPWALTPGNKVQLTYQRPGHANARTIIAEITDMRIDGAGRVAISLNPRMGTDPRSMLIERIKAVRVLSESPAAGRVRMRSTLYARALAHCLDTDEFATAALYAAYLIAAYPISLIHVEGT